MPESTRKLAAIVFTDIVGFTKLTADNQQKASDLLDIQRNEIKPIVESHDGRWIKEMMNFVNGMSVQQQALGKDAWTLRIGINTGPVIAGNTGNNFDIWGDAVNVAARLESSGQEGKIQISEKTKQFLPENAKVTFREKVHLKNKGEMDTFFLEEI